MQSNRVFTPSGSVALGFDAVQRVLQRRDEDFAALVVRHLGLLDQRNGRHQRLDGAGVVSCSVKKNTPFNIHPVDCVPTGALNTTVDSLRQVTGEVGA